MIQVCPHCGEHLYRELKDGISHCTNCNRVFDSSDYNQLLSAAWLVRNHHLTPEQIKEKTNLDDDFSILVYVFAEQCEYSHQEFCKFLEKLGISQKTYKKPEASQS